MSYQRFFIISVSALLAINTFATNVDIVTNTDETDTLKTYSLEGVSVMSQVKDAYRLRQQPLSSYAFSVNDMESLKVKDLRELSLFTPSFVMPNYGSRLTSSVYVRGIGSRINSPAVSIYVDDMPMMSKSAFNQYFLDIDRVEILRGPQGSLYGQNSEGGLVRIYSVAPFNHQGTDINITLGNHFKRRAEVIHHNRVSDLFAFSVGAFYNGYNGFLQNPTTNERADKMNEAGGKMRLMFKPTSRMAFDYSADYQYVRQNAFPYGIIDTEKNRAVAPNTNYQSNYRRNIFTTALNFRFNANGFDFFSTSSYQYLKDYMLMDQDYLPTDFMRLEQRQFQNAFTQELVLKSNTDSPWHWILGTYFSQAWLKTNAPIYFGSGITQPIAKGIESAMYNAMLNSFTARFVAQGIPQQQAAEMAKAAIERAGGVSMSADMWVPGVFRTPQTNLAFFHESNIDITRRLTFTLGLRYDYNRVGISYDTSSILAMTANVMGQQATNYLTSHVADNLHNNFDQLLPKIALTYRFADGSSNVYATVSKGYRAGGYNVQMFSDILQTELMANARNAQRGDYDVPHTPEDFANMAKTIAYQPEKSWNYEAGTHLNLFSGMLHFNLAAYYMQIKNQQVSVMAGNYGYGRRMANAAESSSCGIETSFSGSLFTNRLAWCVSYGFNRAVFKNYSDQKAGDSQSDATVIDYSDNYVPFAPQHTMSAMADYTIKMKQSVLQSIVLGANVSAMGKIYWDEANTMSQPFYATLGAHADANFNRFSLSLWARNITDSHANNFVVGSAASGTQHWFAQPIAPVEFGFDIRLHL